MIDRYGVTFFIYKDFKVVAEKNYLIHPQYIVMVLALFGVTALFLGFSGSYLYNRVQQGVLPVAIPSLFYFNSLLLLGSSFTMWKAKQAYTEDHTDHFRKYLMITLLLTIAFLIAQYFAWKQMLGNNVALNHSTMASYLYLISGLHFAHVILGIPFLVYFILEAYKKMKSPVTVLLYFSDPAKKRILTLLNIYWHFLDGLWIYLVVFFFVNYLIK
ncbi:MAG TPA: cytochrome c oxidase subunit 3 [Saprospiraceae bacterium]|nr:cytochrome c oxidase subunit 3 [Saprospiraceae bacterium]